MNDPGKRAHGATRSVGTNDHPAAQGLLAGIACDRYARRRSASEIEPDHARAAPHCHVTKPRNRGIEVGTDCTVLQSTPCRMDTAGTTIWQLDAGPLGVAIREDAKAVDRHGVGEAVGVVEPELDE